jgi:hypothetical protein
MLLENKNAVIYRAGGSIGGSVARTFTHSTVQALEVAARGRVQ